MREVDLIPESYRRHRARIFGAKLFTGAAGAVVVISAAAWAGLGLATNNIEDEVIRLQTQQTISSQQRDELTRLTSEKASYRDQLHLLTGLRSGASVTELFDMVDKTLARDSVWFTGWQFRRAGVTNSEGQPVETGYFVMAETAVGDNEPWTVETHMSIEGQATDHSELSEFVTRLLAQPEVENVRVRRTELQRFATRSIVDFDLAVVISSHAGDL